MAYENANTYETIELFGLTEKDAQLPIPEDHILTDRIIRESFEALLGQLRGTGLEAEIEPLAHGIATILQRRKVALGKEVDRTADKIGALAKSHDGSEIAETALEEAQARFLHLREIVGAIDDEHDRSLPRPRVEQPGSTVVSGRLNLDEVFEATGFEVPEGPYETLAGYVLARLGHLPQPSEMVEEDGRYRLATPVGASERRRWRWHFARSRIRSTTRWLKHTVTFDNWLPYVVRKAERHTGTTIELTGLEQRWPLLFLWPRAIRLLRSRSSERGRQIDSRRVVGPE